MRRFGLPLLGLGSVAAGLVGLVAPESARTWIFNASWTAAGLFAVLALHVACRKIDDREHRRPWAYLRTACLVWLAGQVGWDVYSVTGAGVPFPALPDVAWLLFAPIALAGVYRLAPASNGEKLVAALDALAVAIVAGAIVGVIYYDNALDSTLSTAGVGFALAYGVLHAAVAATIAQALCTRLSLLRRPELIFLGLGLLAQGLAFSLWAGDLLASDYVPGAPLDLLWTLGLASIGIGGLLAVDGAPVARTTERDIHVRSLLPMVSAIGLVLLLMYLAVDGAPLAERFILLCGLVGVTILFSARYWAVSAQHGKLVERERRATDRADRFFKLAPELFAVTRAGRFLRVNARFTDVLGYSPEELCAVPLLEFVHPDDREHTAGISASLGSGQMHLAFENRYRTKSGEWVWLLWNARPDPESGVIYAAAQDITKRKQSEEALRESEARFAELVTTIPEVFFIANANLGGTIYVSPAYETIWGRSCASLVEDPDSWLEAVHEDDRERVKKGLLKVDSEGGIEHEFRILRPDGEERLVRERVTAIRDSDGVATRHVGIGSDITDQRALELELQHTRRLDAIGQLAGGIAHDFNNILTGVAGYTELALGRDDVDAGLRSDLEEVLGGARRASELTRQLLTFARRQVVQPKIVDLNDVIEGVNGFLRGAIREDILVATDLAPNLPRIEVDPNQLEQVLMNLVLNARDAMPDGGTLSIATRLADPGEVALSIADTGTGMTDEVRSRVFDPFFTTKEVGKGTGLGLATAYGIVEDCGGRISVLSVPGQGSTFTIVLPVTDVLHEGESTPVREPCRGGNERILLVEDDDLVRRLTREMLERDGYTVIVCETPFDAIDETAPWDLLLTDVVMPVLNGPQLAARLAADRPPFRVLFTSGYSGDTMVEEGALDPDMPLLQKPFSREELARKVREVLDEPLSRNGIRPAQPAPA